MLTDEQRESLIQAACEARERAYAPYSRYKVGAAILTGGGRIFTGVNIENASYGLTICAERSAVFAAVGAGVSDFVAIAVCTENAGSPCGACRQVLREFAGDIPVWMTDTGGHVRETTLDRLLPDLFSPEHLPS